MTKHSLKDDERFDHYNDDEILDAADSAHEEKDEDVQLGRTIAGEKQYHALVGGDLKAAPLDDNLVTSNPEKYTPDNAVGALPLRANVKPKQAKAQRKAALDDEMKEWGEKLKQDEGMRVASGFKPKGKVAKPITEKTEKAEPWQIKVAIENGYIKGNKSRLNETLYQFFNDFNGVVDAFGIRAAGVDHGMQKDSNGNLVFVGSMALDRKQRAVSREDGQEENGSEGRARVRTKQSRERVETWYGKGHYDKKVNIPITDTGAVDNASYNPARGDLLLAERITDTKHRTEEVAVFVGPLLPELLKAVFENATAKDIGESLGFAHPQASAVGNAMLQRALEAASDAYARIKRRERGELTYAAWLETQPDEMPVPARKLKQTWQLRAKLRTKIIAEVDQAMVANDNRRIAANAA